jgi:hypothetical protein
VYLTAASMIGVIGALLLPKTARHRLTRECEAVGGR